MRASSQRRVQFVGMRDEAMTVIAKRNAVKPDYLYGFLVVTFLLFAIRDGLTGSIRYFFTIFHIDMLWFVPDFLALISFGIFFYQQFFVKRNIFGIYLVIIFIFSLFVSVLFMNKTFFSFFSSIKMFVPMFVGFCFYDRSITEWRSVRIILAVVFIASAIGLILNPYIEYPWLGQTINSFGLERQATKLWWQEGGVRYGGLAGDSTMAAYMTIFTYFLISFRMSLILNIICWPLVIWAVLVSTSKTALGLFGVYIIVYLIAYFMNDRDRIIRFFRLNARLSYIAILVPPFLMIALRGYDLGSISSSLFSLSDRINNTWPLPFFVISDIFPVGLLVGCGIGCYVYPMEYTDLAYLMSPVDNFYISTYIQMGVPYLIFVLIQFFCIKFSKDPIKLVLILLLNIYTTTIQCYGPSYATLLLGYAFSEMFAYEWRRSRVANSKGRSQSLMPTSAAITLRVKPR